MREYSLTRRNFIRAAAAAAVLVTYAAKTAGAGSQEGGLEEGIAAEPDSMVIDSALAEEDLLDTHMFFERPPYGPK